MSMIIRSAIQNLLNVNKNVLQKVIPLANFSVTAVRPAAEVQEGQGIRRVSLKKLNPEFYDRTKVIAPETSIRYMKSSAYKTTYGTDPVWKNYRRNHKYSRPPTNTRKTCIRQRQLSGSNPCPICRDIYLVLDYRNIDLLKQFVSPYNGEILSHQTTNICQRQHQNLLVALHKAKDYGTLSFDVAFRHYNYKEWYPDYEGEEKDPQANLPKEIHE